ncbi:polyadenylation and cleavage factor homolog 4 [Vicia villosa]|uniref:polyadenylation and cleavage factor homolog 4 n=1 Tax=Vicia villosa TaxID=3911 RepID=UPI00273C4149|nr:polyadenylation and cleavage factor homolog 4 [Vicia villosa]
MSNENGQKPPPSILVGRFKALLKQREDDPRLRNSQPSTEEIVQIYEALLGELTSNVKPIITDLTIIAEQHREHARGIAYAICARILEVSAEHKLPSLYLLDSVVKNVGQEYVRYFSLRLPEVFCEAYRQVNPSLHSAMRHLFSTWSKVFPPSVLRKIEAQLQFSQAVNNQPSSVNPLRASESPRPTHGIHVNPKYIRQMEHSTSIMDSVVGERLGSPGTVGNANFGLAANKVHQLVPSRVGKSSSPSGIGLDRHMPSYMDEYVVDNSAGRIVERESPHRAVDYGLVKGLSREEELRDWPRKQFSGDGPKRFPTSMTYSLSNGQPRQNPRALIDAYGSDKSQETSGSKPLLVERLDRNGMDKVVTTSWQNTEEEEFDWEDMSPTLVDHSRNNGFLQPTIGFSSEKPVTIPGSATSSVSRIFHGLKSNMEYRPPVLPATFEIRNSINVHAPRPPSLNPTFPFKNPVRNPFESINANSTIVSHGLNRPFPIHEQSLPGVENNDISKRNPYQLPNQLAGLISSNPQNPVQTPQLQFFPSQDSAASQFSYRPSLQGHGAAISTPMSNVRPVMPFPLPGQRTVNNSFHFQGGPLRPLPPAGPHAPSQMLPHPNPSPFVSSQQPTVGYSNLINSLMAQGVISLANQAPAQDFVGIEFDPDILKVRHESAIKALYGDLPRQCTTCGLRFKSQDEHSSHMDWHVTKNRMSKNRKQKPSRKWFVSETMWLSGAEALGAESAPGFLPTETTEEKKEDEELAVPAEEDQNTCALCGEPFDEFYSDETEEWMYRGAVYLNAPNGITAGMDRSQLGPVIHAKCRSESTSTPTEECVMDEGGTYEEGNERKRMRVV